MSQPDDSRGSSYESHRIQVPGGWIYHGGPLSHPVLVLDPDVWGPGRATAAVDPILAAIDHLKQEIRTMSTTISGEIDAATKELQADLATLTTGVTQLEAELAAALAGVTPGSTVTQAQVDALTAVHTSFAALAASISPATPTPAPTPAAA
jgi:hypothetical protein